MKSFSKTNFIKVIGAGTLATCMLATSLFAFIPNSTQAETLNSNQSLSNIQSNTTTTENAGLIIPRADDPVLFTTENGLEIKYGNATFQGNISSGGLTGLPYFRTSKNGTNYDWVLLATRYYDFAYLSLCGAEDAIWSDKFSPLIAVQPNNESYILHEEIPEGCWLAILNDNSTLDAWRSTCWAQGFNTIGWGEVNDNVRDICHEYYSNDSFGFGDKLSMLLAVNLISNCLKSSATSLVTTSNSYFFLLDYSISGTNFWYETYLTKEMRQLTTTYWCRSIVSNNYGGAIDVGGNFIKLKDSSQYISGNSDPHASIRPVCCVNTAIFL